MYEYKATLTPVQITAAAPEK